MSRQYVWRCTAFVFLAVGVCAAVGCASPERRNKDCQWPSDESRSLNLADRSDQRHLDDDVQLADELATRYADHQHKIPYGYEGHGGLLEGGQVVRSCLAALETIIQQTHGVTEDQIVGARRHRPWVFDAFVLLVFAVVYGFIAVGVCRLLGRYDTVANTKFRYFAVTAATLPISAAGVQLLDMCSTTAEMIRVGNDHLGTRGALIPWQHHTGELLIAGAVFFWVVAFTKSRRRPVSAAAEATVSRVLELH